MFGHSLGGLFVLHALFNRPCLFHGYVAGSPSVWWNRHAVLEDIPEFQTRLAKLDNPPKLMITIGMDELEHMIGDAREVAARLDCIPGSGFHCSLVHFPEEGHVSVLPAAISRTVKFALG
ncbi:alpha/beta hydrolase [Paenibacillus sp. CAU 1782]